MRRILVLIAIISVAFIYCSAEEQRAHQLWNIDLASMDVDMIHEYLDKERGIQSKIIRNYDHENHNSLVSIDNQELTLIGYPFSLQYTEFTGYKSISLYFKALDSQFDSYALIDALIEKYGKPTIAYYELYSKSRTEWLYNIKDPMYHRIKVLDSIEGFQLLATLLSWEHYEDYGYQTGDIQLTVFIDNINVEVRCNCKGKCTVSITYYSKVPTPNIEDIEESRNIPKYTDNGF